MSDRRVGTIDIGKGIQYAKVASRSAEFHKDNDVCHIATVYELVEGAVIFSATVTTKKGTFTGHAMDKVGGRQKAFEKLETIAVGRALAFAGYLADGEIACAEEMVDVVTVAQLNSLKQKFATVHQSELAGKDRPEKLAAFRHWCLDLFDDEVDYSDPGSWNREWYNIAWRSLIAGDSDVPFEAEE